jgi:hypothetical protein
MIRLIETIQSVDELLAEDVVLAPERYLERMQGVLALMRDPNIEDGERQVAQLALTRLITSAKEQAEHMRPEDRTDFEAKITRLVGSKNYAPKQPTAPAADDLPVPTAFDQTMTYTHGGDGYKLTAEVKRIRHEVVKRGESDTAYYSVTFSLIAGDYDGIVKALGDLGWSESKSAREPTYYSPENDQFIVMWVTGKARTRPMMLMDDDLQRKLKAYGLRPVGEVQPQPAQLAAESVALDEKAPPGREAETWIKHRKKDFKERYGKRWKQVLYAKAWKLFGN